MIWDAMLYIVVAAVAALAAMASWALCGTFALFVDLSTWRGRLNALVTALAFCLTLGGAIFSSLAIAKAAGTIMEAL